MKAFQGPKGKIVRRFGVNIFEADKYDRILGRRKFPPGMHGNTRRSGKISDISILKWDSSNLSQFIAGLFPIFLAILSGFFFACMQLLIQEAVKKFTPAFVNIWRLGVTLCLLFVLLLIFLPNLQSIFNPNSKVLLWAAIAAFLGPFMARLFYSYACQREFFCTFWLFGLY